MKTLNIDENPNADYVDTKMTEQKSFHRKIINTAQNQF